MHRGRRLRRKIRLCADLVRGNESALPPRSVDCACSRKRSKARPLVVQEAAPEVLEPQRRTPKLGKALGVALPHAAARRVNANEALAAVNCTAPRNRARPRFADRRGRTGPGRATPRERKLHSRATLQRPQLLRVQPQARRVKPRQLTQALRQAAKLPRRPRREILRLDVVPRHFDGSASEGSRDVHRLVQTTVWRARSVSLLAWVSPAEKAA